MVKLVALLVVVLLAIDILIWQRLAKSGVKSTMALRILFMAICAVDLLPALMSLIYLCFSDNTPVIMHISLWAMWLFLLLAIPKSIISITWLSTTRKWSRLMGYGIAVLFGATIVYGTITRDDIKVNRINIAFDNLPAEFDGFRMAHISDIHVGSMINPHREISTLIDSLNSLDADIVIFTGDLINVRCDEIDSATTNLLGAVTARHGVLSVTGNHDMGYYVKDTIATPREVTINRLAAIHKQIGWRLLDNESITISRDKESISFTGISFADTLRKLRHDKIIPLLDIDHSYRTLPSDIFNITLAHIPQMWQEILNSGYGDLTLAGHVHSMQTKITIFGHSFSPARLVYPKWSGLYVEQHTNRKLYINDGIGYVGVPLRIGAKPEITLITLHR